MKKRKLDLKLGQKVTIKLDHLGGLLVEGTVKRIRVEVDTEECGTTLVSPKRIVEVK